MGTQPAVIVGYASAKFLFVTLCYDLLFQVVVLNVKTNRATVAVCQNTGRRLSQSEPVDVTAELQMEFPVGTSVAAIDAVSVNCRSRPNCGDELANLCNVYMCRP